MSKIPCGETGSFDIWINDNNDNQYYLRKPRAPRVFSCVLSYFFSFEILSDSSLDPSYLRAHWDRSLCHPEESERRDPSPKKYV